MNTKNDIDRFFAEKKVALVGFSRNPKHFSRMAYKSLVEKGFDVFPVNPNMGQIDDKKVYNDISEIPKDVKRAIFMTSKQITPQEIEKAISHGVDHIWVQQGAHSEESLKKGDPAGVFIHNKCIMMFADPVKGVHAFHRFLAKLFNRMPA
jgi:hypothetical protein